jgi:hypothetical protein
MVEIVVDCTNLQKLEGKTMLWWDQDSRGKPESHQQPFKQQFTKRKGTSPARQFS